MKKVFILFVIISMISYSFTTIREPMNPLLAEYNTPFETAPFDKIKPSHFEPAFEVRMKEARKKIEDIKSGKEVPNFENTIVALEYSTLEIKHLQYILMTLHSAETNDEIQEVVKIMSPRLVEFASEITTDEMLFEKVKHVYEYHKNNKLPGEDQRLLEKTYLAFVRNGAALKAEDKEKLIEINKKLASLSVSFAENVLAETNAFYLHVEDKNVLKNMPQNALETASDAAEARKVKGWVFTLHYPSYSAFMKYAEDRELREKMYREYNSKGFHDNANNNEEVIKEIVNLRRDKALLLGYKTYAHFVLDERMAKSPENVFNFLHELNDAALPYGKKDMQEMKDYAASLSLEEDLKPWDWSYYSEKLKTSLYNINDEMTRPYFALNNVQEGVFDLFNRLYGLSFKENKNIPVYHSDVKTFEVYDADNTLLAVIYLDFFPREGKRQGAWTGRLRTEYKMNGKRIIPHTTMTYNFTPPANGTPSLLSFREVSTFLHEFGHAAHEIVSNCKYPSLSGTKVYWDFVELPSQIMENWADEKEWLMTIARHYKTGEPIPQDMIDNIIEARNFHSATATLRQIGLGLTDMAYHSITSPFDTDIYAFENDATKPVDLFEPIEGTTFGTSFSHIFAGGYATGYYGYKWAEVLDADAFSVFKEKGIFDKNTATSFRKNILEKGDTEDPMVLYTNFRGKEPSIDALLERSGLK